MYKVFLPSFLTIFAIVCNLAKVESCAFPTFLEVSLKQQTTFPLHTKENIEMQILCASQEFPNCRIAEFSNFCA